MLHKDHNWIYSNYNIILNFNKLNRNYGTQEDFID